MSQVEQSRNHLIVAAESGDAQAMCELGISYMGEDQAKALKWLMKAAEVNHATAMYWLGDFYAQGTGVTKDDRQAATWFRRAAEAGDVAGMERYAEVLRQGRGVARNEVEAERWLAMVNSRRLPGTNAIEAALCGFYSLFGMSPSTWTRMGVSALLLPLFVAVAVLALGVWLVARMF